jgi:tetrahydromethanopterin S-methyltransferase subunit A
MVKERPNPDKELEEELDNAIDTSDAVLEWKADPMGYFTIKPFPSRGKVFVRYYSSDNILKCTFAGVNASQIIQSIIKRKLVSRLYHAAYLGKEIEKAVIALNNKLNYIQDQELRLKDKNLADLKS